MTTPEHDMHAFLRVQSRLNKLETGIPVAMNEPLSKALEKLSCFPSMSLSSGEFSTTCEFSIEGEPAGSFDNPNIDLIKNKSAPSAFGRGEETVMDETYRRGGEISAAKIE